MKNGKPLISVVIPAYNEEKHLPLCLSAFKKQTFKNFELIVVDNNSTDKTAEIARSFGAKVVREKTKGIIPAREKGYREAQCEIIARTDADTIVSSNWLETIYETFTEKPRAVALMGTLHSPYRLIPHKVFRGITFFCFVALGKIVAGHVLLLGPNMALKKSAWAKIKPHYDDKLVHEDIDLAFHLAQLGEIIYVPHLTVTFSPRRIHENFLRGLYQYAGEYPLRYLRTIAIHKPKLKHLVGKKFNQ